MVELPPGSVYVRGTDLLLSSRRQHASTELKSTSELLQTVDLTVSY